MVKKISSHGPNVKVCVQFAVGLLFLLCTPLYAKGPNLAIIPEIRCDTVELNHVYTEFGLPRMDQLLFLDWISHKDGTNGMHVNRFIVIPFQEGRRKYTQEEHNELKQEWKKHTPPQFIPTYFGTKYIYTINKRRMDDMYEIVVYIKSYDEYVRVITPSFIESHTQYDKELADRDFFNKEMRLDWKFLNRNKAQSPF